MFSVVMLVVVLLSKNLYRKVPLLNIKNYGPESIAVALPHMALDSIKVLQHVYQSCKLYQ